MIFMKNNAQKRSNMPYNRSAYRTIQILYLFAKEQPLSLADVTNRLNLPKTSAYDILQAMVVSGALEVKDNRAKTYILSPRMLSIGKGAKRGQNLYSVAHRYISELSQLTGQTVYLAIPSGKRIVYLDKAEAKNIITFIDDIGDENYTHSTGLGKAMLETFVLQGQDIEKYVELPLKKFTDNTITDLEALVENLKSVSKCGYAIDNKEGSEFMKCVAAPILNENRETVAAISIAMLADEMDRLGYESMGLLVNETAIKISQSIGYNGSKLFMY